MTKDIEFYLAHGEADACGRGCDEWIAAEGQIDHGAAQRLRRLLAKLHGHRPPLYFHSPGGNVSGALELGRLIHEQNIEVRIGHTLVHDCDGAKPVEKSAEKPADKPADASCEARKRSGQTLAAEIDAMAAMCNSACVYAFAAGRVRAVPPPLRLGIHDVGYDSSKTAPHGARLLEAENESHAQIREYLREMGFDGALAAESFAVPHESAKYLERDDIVRLGLDRREFGEDDWRFVGEPQPFAVKRFFVRSDDERPRYLDISLMLKCGNAKFLVVVLSRRRVDAGSSAPALRNAAISLSGQRIAMPVRIRSGDLDVYWASVAVGKLEGASDDATIVVPGGYLDRKDDTDGSVTLSMVGFTATRAKLHKACDEAALATASLRRDANPAVRHPEPGQSAGLTNNAELAPLRPRQDAQPATAAPDSSDQGSRRREPNPPVRYLQPEQSAGLTSGMQLAPLRSRQGTQPIKPVPTAPVTTVPGASVEAKATPADCTMQLATAPQHRTGRVIGLVPDVLARAGTRAIEADLGAKISPAYLALKRANVALDPQGDNRSTMAAIPDNMAVQVGDLVELDTRYRDPSLPCNFIPWTIDRRLDHAE